MIEYAGLIAVSMNVQLDFRAVPPQSNLMKNRQDTTELLEYSGEHLMHEITTLWQTAATLPRYAEGTIEYVALLESFARRIFWV